MPRQDTSNEYPNLCFCGDIRQIFFEYPLLSGAMSLN